MTRHFVHHLLDALTDPEEGAGYFWISPAEKHNPETLWFNDGLVPLDELKAIVDRAIESYDAELDTQEGEQ